MGYAVAAVWTFKMLRSLGRWLEPPDGKQTIDDVATAIRGVLRLAIEGVRAGYRAHLSQSWRVAKLVSRVGGPVTDSSEMTASSSVAPAQVLPIWRSKGPSQIRVFIVDDHTETRDNLAKLIGFESDMKVVGVARGGAEALRNVAGTHPDVVLMDMNMPVMDGLMATEVLTEMPGWKAPVVMMSIRDSERYRRAALRAGARGYLVKPFSADEFIGFIREVHRLENAARVVD
jgi:CheY-like chemotaxis protein